MKRVVLSLVVAAIVAVGTSQARADQAFVQLAVGGNQVTAATVQPVHWEHYGHHHHGPAYYGRPRVVVPPVVTYPYTTYRYSYPYAAYPYTVYPYSYGYVPGGVYYSGPRVTFGFGW
jgi:hypothetical protein